MKRKVINQDANLYLNTVVGEVPVIITSLPDMEEVGMDLIHWQAFIRKSCYHIINSMSDKSIVFFYQTNRKSDGRLIDKDYLISNVFYEHGFNKVFTKIMLKMDAGKVNLYRPSYTNLFCFSKKMKAGKSTADVIYAGKMLYKNAMGFNAVEVCLDWIEKKMPDAKTILDPFCGQGSVLKLANDRGFDAIGVDIDKEMCKKSKEI